MLSWLVLRDLPCQSFLPRHSSSFCLPLCFRLALTKKGKEELSSTEQQRREKNHQILAPCLCFKQLNVFGGLVLITRSWQVPAQSAEQFYQVIRKSWNILANNHALNLLNSYQTFSIGKPAIMIFGEISLSYMQPFLVKMEGAQGGWWNWCETGTLMRSTVGLWPFKSMKKNP